MKDKHCCGFLYDTEDELKGLLGIDEYLDMVNTKRTGWIPEDMDSNEMEILNCSLGMDVYTKRKAEGLTQRELAKKLGVGVETLSKIENGHENLSSKVKTIFYDYLNDEEYFL